MNHRGQSLLEGASSGALEDVVYSDGGNTESLNGVLDAGEASGGSVNKDSAGVNNINNHGNLAKVFSVVHVNNSTRLNEVLENLKIQSLLAPDTK
jgi:hypothetical protein